MMTSNTQEKAQDELNLEFWNKYKTPDTSFVKQIIINKQTRTVIDAQYKKWMITKAFGMYGNGWGIVAGSEKYERIHYENSTCVLQYTATAFYKRYEETFEIPIAASIKEAYITNGGKGYLKIDDEAVKKVRTDALTKGFTDLGFTADVFLGLFDDQDYLAGVALQEQINNEDESEKAVHAAIKEIGDYCKSQIESAMTVKSYDQFEKAMNRIAEKVKTRCMAAKINPERFIDRIEQLKDERKNASK